MENKFINLVRKLYHQCDKNLSEVARRSGLSVAYLHRALHGQGARDPHTHTWKKLYQALDKDPRAIREDRVVYKAEKDQQRIGRIEEWLAQHPEHIKPVEAFLSHFGYETPEGEENP